MSEERYFRIVGQNVDLYNHQFVIGDIVLFQEEDVGDDSFLLIRLDHEDEWWVETQALEEVFKPKSPKFVKLCEDGIGFRKLIPGYAYEVLFEDEGEWGYIYQVRELLTDNTINCKVSKNRFEVLKAYDMLASKETKEIIDIVSSSALDKQEDKGKHYRYSFRLNLTEEDKKNGFVMVNIDPYRISEVYKLGGWREHLVKKGIRGTEKGHSEEELIEELQCTLDRAKQMLEESKE